MKRLLDVSASGATETYEYDEDGERILVHHQEDPTRFVDHTKRVASEWDGWNADKSRRLAAHIPDSVVYEWLLKHGVNVFNKNHMGAVARLLDSNEYRYLRVGHFIMGNYE